MRVAAKKTKIAMPNIEDLISIILPNEAKATQEQKNSISKK